MSRLEMASDMTQNESVHLKEQVDKALAEKDLELAIDIYAKALEKDPNNIDLIVDTGNLYSNLMQYSLADKYYIEALNLDVKSFRANHNRALNFYKQELYDDAIVYFDKALLIKPDSYFTLNSLGNLYSKTGKDEEAVSIFNHAIELQPDNFVAAYNLGKHYFRIGDWDYVLNSILSYKDSIPSQNLEDFYLLIGRAYYKLHDYQNTIFCYSRLHEIRPDWQGYLIVLGESYRLSQQHSTAVEYYEEVLRTDPSNVDIVRRLTWCHYHNTNKEIAFIFASEQIKKFSDCPHLNYLFSLLLFERGEFNLASEYIGNALKHDEYSYGFNALAGLIHEKTEKWDLAKSHFQYVLENKEEFLAQKSEEYYVYPDLMLSRIEALIPNYA